MMMDVEPALQQYLLEDLDEIRRAIPYGGLELGLGLAEREKVM
jgi:hypothetical protein